MASQWRRALAYLRLPGNELSFALRSHITWSRGLPQLPREDMDRLFAHLFMPPESNLPAQASGDTDNQASLSLTPSKTALNPHSIIDTGALAQNLARDFKLIALYRHSTQALYRKTLYLLHCWNSIAEGTDLFASETTANSPPASELKSKLRVLDVGPQDWHYVFALNQWLTHYRSPLPRQIEMLGLEVDPYERYRDLHTRRDYALAYLAQTGNPHAEYREGDILKHNSDLPYDMVFWLFPIVTVYETLLWGLPARYCRPQATVAKLADMTRSGGWLMLMAHTGREHALASEYLVKTGRFQCRNQGFACNTLIDFHARIRDRRISLWQRI